MSSQTFQYDGQKGRTARRLVAELIANRVPVGGELPKSADFRRLANSFTRDSPGKFLLNVQVPTHGNRRCVGTDTSAV